MSTATETAPKAVAKTAWKLDPAHTLVEFSAKHMMISTVKGRITDIEGTIYTDEKNAAHSSVEANLKSVSIDTRAEQRDQHLRSADFLNAEQFPEITFKSRKIDGDAKRFKLTGDLTIRDVTREITLDVEFGGRNRDPGAGSALGSVPPARSTAAISDLSGIRRSRQAESSSERHQGEHRSRGSEDGLTLSGIRLPRWLAASILP